MVTVTCHFRLKLMQLASQYCFDGSSPDMLEKFPDKYLDDDVFDAINGIVPALNETLIFCKLFNKWIKCDELFVPQITERGLCYSFNTLNVHDMFANE